MKTIKVFLASSEELKEERQKFGNLIRRLDEIYRKRGIHLQLLVWEDMDPCYNNVRKQDEYNAWIRESDIFVCIFYTRAGQYTLEEFEIAKQENVRKSEPKLMIFCHDLQPNEKEKRNLCKFKKRLAQELGYFWINYPTTDKLHLDFVMFFMNSDQDNINRFRVENGRVLFEDLHIASLENLPFISENTGYKKMKNELAELNEEIKGIQLELEKKNQKLLKRKARLDKNPSNEEYLEDYQESKEDVESLNTRLQPKLNKYYELKKELDNHQQSLFDTARRISVMQFEKVSSELQRAMAEFNKGCIEAANVILDGIEHEADSHIEQLNHNRKIVHQDIKALRLKARTLMAEPSIPIQQRIDRVITIYQKACNWAEWSSLEKNEFSALLYDYGKFLYDYSKYELALRTWLRECQINEELYGTWHPKTAKSYNVIGYVYYRQDDYEKALEYHKKALAIREKELGTEHPDTATSYSNIALVFYGQQEYNHALENHHKALAIREKVFGEKHPYTATSYYNIGKVYYNQEKYELALEYYQRALNIRKTVYEIQHPDTAKVYNSIGKVYYSLGDYTQALKYYQDALNIFEVVVGIEHAYTAKTFCNIGEVYLSQGEFGQALRNYQKALAIFEKVLVKGHSTTRNVKDAIETVKSKMKS